MMTTCGGQLRGEEDVYYGKGKTCGAPATHWFKDYLGVRRYRCATCAAILSSAVKLSEDASNPPE